MEQFANAMSPVSKTVIVAESPTSIQSHGPWGVGFRNWMQSPVGEGTFTVESDKVKLGPSIRKLIEARKAQCTSMATSASTAFSAPSLRGC